MWGWISRRDICHVGRDKQGDICHVGDENGQIYTAPVHAVNRCFLQEFIRGAASIRIIQVVRLGVNRTAITGYSHMVL